MRFDYDLAKFPTQDVSFSFKRTRFCQFKFEVGATTMKLVTLVNFEQVAIFNKR